MLLLHRKNVGGGISAVHDCLEAFIKFCGFLDLLRGSCEDYSK